MADSGKNADNTHLAPCIVAAWVWLAIVLFSLIVISNTFNLEAYLHKPEQMRAGMPATERAMMTFQQLRGTFVCALVGALGCFMAYARRSTLVANAMILLGIAVMLTLVWATMSTIPK